MSNDGPVIFRHPPKPECRCDCGYRCGGPGRCSLDVFECLATNDGKHFVRDCAHKFGGPLIDLGRGCHSVACQTCGLSAMTHDEWCGP